MAEGIEQKLEDEGIKEGLGLAKKGGAAAFKGAMDFAKDESRKVKVKITNNTKQKWKNPKFFMDCGMTDDLLPLTVKDGKDLEYEVHKKKWTFSGIAAVITYEWTADQKTYHLAVAFRSPSLSRNCWNAVISEEETGTDQKLYDTLMRERGETPMVRGDANYTRREFGPYVMQGAMSSSGTAKLHVTISCAGEEDEEEEEQQEEEQTRSEE